jgi:hypothetical protein
MQSVLARIHPSFRTAMAAWLICRSALWLLYLASGTGELGFGALGETESGGPLWMLAGGLYGWVGSTWSGSAAGWLFFVLAEIVFLLSLVHVYRFVRHDALPQTAERATWFWALCPIAGMNFPVTSWTMATAAAVVSLSCARSMRPYVSAFCMIVALGFRLEVLLLWPGILWLAFQVFPRGKSPIHEPLAVAMAPITGACLTVGLGVWMAGSHGVSFRSLHAQGRWRDWAAEMRPVDNPDFLLALAVALIGCTMAVRFRKQIPVWGWLLLSFPALVWPLLHTPSWVHFPVWGLALPLFALVGLSTHDPARERVVIVLFVVGLILPGVLDRERIVDRLGDVVGSTDLLLDVDWAQESVVQDESGQPIVLVESDGERRRRGLQRDQVLTGQREP